MSTCGEFQTVNAACLKERVLNVFLFVHLASNNLSDCERNYMYVLYERIDRNEQQEKINNKDTIVIITIKFILTINWMK